MGILFLLILCFSIFLFNLCPTISSGDSGEFCASSIILGLPHSPSYPFFCILGKIFTIIIPFGDLAYRINILSAFFAILTTFFIYKIINILAEKNNKTFSLFVSILFPFSLSIYRTSIQTEVFTLNVFFVSLIIYLYIYFIKSQDKFLNTYLYLISYIFGIGLGNHHTIIFIIPGIFISFIILLKTKLEYFKKGFLKNLTLCFIFFLIGFSIYLYLPVRASKTPALNWGNPVNFHNFYRVITRADYGSLRLTVGEKLNYNLNNTVKQLLRFLKNHNSQFTLIGLILGIIGICYGYKKNKLITVLIFISWFISGPGFIFLSYLPFDAQSDGILERFFIMSNFFWIFFIFLATEYILNLINKKYFLFFILLVILFYNFYINLKQNNLRNYYLTYDYGKNILNTFKYNTIFFIDGGDDTFYSLAYLCFGKKLRQDIELHDRGGLVFKNIYGNDFRSLTKEEKEIRRNITEKKFINQRPVFYSTFNKKILPDCELIQRGILYCVKNNEYKNIDYFEFYSLRSLYKEYYDYRSRALVPVYIYFKGLMKQDIELLKYFDYAYNKWPEVLWLKHNIIIELHERAYSYFQNNNFYLSELFYKKIIEIKQDDTYALVNLGVIYEKKNMLDTAKNIYERAIKINPDYTEAYYNLGVIYWREKNWAKVIENFKRVLQINPDHQGAKQYLPKAQYFYNFNR